MRVESLKRLIKLVEESEISELEIKRWATTVRIAKQRSGKAVKANPQGPPVQAVTPVPTEKRSSDLVSVTSPMVGTFYRSAGPDAPAYVEIGDFVKRGQVVCIIEAMKLMNEIESEVAGEVVQILVKNEEPVEYGQELLLVRPV